MTTPPGPGEHRPGPQTPGPYPPGSFPPGSVPPWPVPPWAIRYPGPKPDREALVFARVMLAIQAVIWTIGLFATPAAFFQSPLPPGVTSSYGYTPPSLTRNVIVLLINLLVVAVTVTTTFRLAPSRRRLWWLALVTQAALAIAYGWLIWQIAVAPSPEGMASFAAVTVGPFVVAVPVLGVVALLLPSARAAAFRRRALPGPR
ncbi:MAG: hypothetical protein ACM3ML_31165 [Micromonosporaceae bacterium]